METVRRLVKLEDMANEIMNEICEFHLKMRAIEDEVRKTRRGFTEEQADKYEGYGRIVLLLYKEKDAVEKAINIMQANCTKMMMLNQIKEGEDL